MFFTVVHTEKCHSHNIQREQNGESRGVCAHVEKGGERERERERGGRQRERVRETETARQRNGESHREERVRKVALDDHRNLQGLGTFSRGQRFLQSLTAIAAIAGRTSRMWNFFCGKSAQTDETFLFLFFCWERVLR